LRAGGQSGSDNAARWRFASLIASKARQSLFGGFFGLSLKVVIFPFFMWFRSSGGYDTNDVTTQRVAKYPHGGL
jgi:hypothetical protein